MSETTTKMKIQMKYNHCQILSNFFFRYNEVKKSYHFSCQINSFLTLRKIIKVHVPEYLAMQFYKVVFNCILIILVENINT